MNDVLSMPEFGRSVVSIDIEGDGQRIAFPIEIAFCPVGGSSEQVRSWLIKPPGDIDRYATRVHGLAARDVEHAPLAAEVEAEFLRALGTPLVVGHGIRHDLVVLARAFPRMPQLECIDTLPMAKQLLPGLPGYDLNVVAKALGVQMGPIGRGLHSAGHDAALGAAVFDALCSRPNARRYLVGTGHIPRLGRRPAQESLNPPSFSR